MTRQRWFAPLCGVVAAVMLCGATARGQVLEQVPQDALLVIKVNNLGQVSDSIANLAQQWGLAGFRPELADPLGSLRQQTGIQNGLATDRDMAIVLLAPPEEGAEPPTLVLIPVSDYEAFVGNFQGAQTDGEVTTFQFANEMTDSYAANWGDYAAVSNEQAIVAEAPEQGVQVQGDVTQAQLDEKDMIVWVNMAQVRELALPELQANREQMLADIEAEIAGGENPDAQAFGPAIRALANQAMNVAEAALQDTQSALYGIDLSNEGIGMSWAAEFAPDSYAANLVQELSGTQEALITGLPQTDYLMVGGMTLNSEALATAMEDFVAPARPELAEAGEKGQAVVTYLDAMIKAVRASERNAFGLVQPSGQMGQGGIFQILSVTTGDADAIVEATKESYQTQNELMSLFTGAAGAGGGQAGAPQMSVNIAEDAKEVGGVQFDRIATEFGGDPNDPQAAQMQQMMQMMYGPEGATAYVGQIGDDKVITFMGGDDATLAQLVEAAQEGTEPLEGAQPVQAVDGQLPDQRIAVGYIMVDNMVTTGVAYAQQFGMPVQLQLPEDLPPVGMTLATEGTALRGDMFIPSDLVQSIIAAGMQAMMQMQGQQQPGGPGGL